MKEWGRDDRAINDGEECQLANTWQIHGYLQKPKSYPTSSCTMFHSDIRAAPSSRMSSPSAPSTCSHLPDLSSDRRWRRHDVVSLHGERNVVGLGQPGLGAYLAHHLDRRGIEVVRQQDAVRLAPVAPSAWGDPHNLNQRAGRRGSKGLRDLTTM